MRHIKLILLYLFLFTNIAFADTLDKYIDSLNEQTTSAEWVVENAQTKLTQQQAQSIVSHTYAHSLSSDINPKLLLALIKTESGFISNAKSNHKAIGLTQIIPRWHKEKLKKRSPLDPIVAIEVGVLVLKDCIEKHKGNINYGLKCYSGGSKKYHTKVNSNLLSLKTFIQNTTEPRLASN